MKKKILIIDIIFIIISLFLFLFDMQDVIDHFIYDYFFFHPILTNFFKLITILGDAITIILILLVLFIYQRKRNKTKEIATFSGISFISFIVMLTLKALFKRERPNIMQLIEITGFSFPSGHAYFSMLIYGYLAYLIYQEKNKKYRKRKIAILIILISLIGISRIYLGVHYLTDIIFGYSLGLLSLLIFICIKEKYLKSSF